MAALPYTIRVTGTDRLHVEELTVCPICHDVDAALELTDFVETLVEAYQSKDAKGEMRSHTHDPNCTSGKVTCSNGHAYKVSHSARLEPCPAGCTED